MCGFEARVHIDSSTCLQQRLRLFVNPAIQHISVSLCALSALACGGKVNEVEKRTMLYLANGHLGHSRENLLLLEGWVRVDLMGIKPLHQHRPLLEVMVLSFNLMCGVVRRGHVQCARGRRYLRRWHQGRWHRISLTDRRYALGWSDQFSLKRACLALEESCVG